MIRLTSSRYRWLMRISPHLFNRILRVVLSINHAYKLRTSASRSPLWKWCRCRKKLSSPRLILYWTRSRDKMKEDIDKCIAYISKAMTSDKHHDEAN
jgi:hypothetical protein